MHGQGNAMSKPTKLRAWRRGALVVVGALVLSTVGIQAADISNGVVGGLSGLVYTADTGPCGAHESLLRFGSHATCVDNYEASAGSGCPFTETKSGVDSTVNLETVGCVPQTMPGAPVWRFVSYTQAKQLCARVGKRLPTADEWYRTALGLADDSQCVLSAQAARPSGEAVCHTGQGIADVVGNVWEWTDDTIVEGKYGDRYLPKEGYVDLVDDRGLVVRTGDAPNRDFGGDYAWVRHDVVQGILRGGFYGSGEDGGIFSQNMAVPLDFAAAGVGFRCVRDV